jgi:galactokinase
MIVRAVAPGRVNLIGDHTDYAGGLVMPMAIDLATTVVLSTGGRVVELSSAADSSPAIVALDNPFGAAGSGWARYVAGVVAAVGPATGGRGTVSTTLPIGAGLSSSAALEVAAALALGFHGSPLDLAQACQRAEQLASGVPCGIMDQLASAVGVADHALLIDCSSLEVTPVPLPDDVEIVVIHSGETRALASTAYGERRAQVEAAATALGAPLRGIDAGALADPLLRRRARHVTSENDRVRDFAEALRGGDLRGAGTLMFESHRSLATDFEVSTPTLDALVDALRTDGVYGARLTGAGFGGCVIALVGAGAGSALAARFEPAWVVRAAAGATVVEDG